MDSLMIISIFVITILFSNIIQGITGFAGTLIAMPFLLFVMDMEAAKIILNLYGILGSLWIVYKDYKFIRWKELVKIITIMIIGVIIGIVAFDILPRDLLSIMYPIFLIFVALRGFYVQFKNIDQNSSQKQNKWMNSIILVFAGIIHGLFISGGPLLVVYATNNLQKKEEFRATLSSVWIVLNSIIFVQSLFRGEITGEIWTLISIGTIPLIVGIIIGGILLKILSREKFLLLSYFLILFAGITQLI